MAIETLEALDLVVVGAGVSGINCAYRLQTDLPHVKFTVLEGRDDIGGTWDLFRYPGVRSDSSLDAYRFSWEPWPYAKPIASAGLVMEYLRTCVSKHGLDRHIRYRHKVLSMDWSSKTQRWTLVVDHEGRLKQFLARFVFLGAGYFDYETPRQTTIPGLAENFAGTVLHPQFWPADYDHAGQHVVVVGSGATAVSLLPALAARAAAVTLCQRSPSYVLPTVNRFARPWWRPRACERVWLMVATGLLTLYYKYLPGRARSVLRRAAEAQLPDDVPVDPHFAPRYRVWDQRLCYAPDADFYRALRGPGGARVVTGSVRRVTARAVEMEDGQRVDDVDAIVTATGIRMRLGGGINMRVDGDPVEWRGRTVWNGAMLEDVPNMIFAFGYVSASWTLGADCAARVLVRLWRLMDRRGTAEIVPRLPEGEDRAALRPVRFWPLESTYSREARDGLPTYANAGPWRPRMYPFLDYLHARWGDITTGLQFVT
ncbi:FAD/NAD(P)-binding domain-containing protein [Hypoxylon sp. FL1284]|nr:FAD/NAD(P)-binding domain-containing protein [Hypoxylon sp. FL1284]